MLWNRYRFTFYSCLLRHFAASRCHSDGSNNTMGIGCAAPSMSHKRRLTENKIVAKSIHLAEMTSRRDSVAHVLGDANKNASRPHTSPTRCESHELPVPV